MVFIERDENNAIKGVYMHPQQDIAIDELDGNSAEVVAFMEKDTLFKPLSRPAFLFMLAKIGKTTTDVEALISAMPESTQAEQDAKLLAGLVFAENTTFQRDNALLNTLSAAAGLTTVQIDDAWRVGESLTW